MIMAIMISEATINHFNAPGWVKIDIMKPMGIIRNVRKNIIGSKKINMTRNIMRVAMNSNPARILPINNFSTTIWRRHLIRALRILL